MPLIHISFGYYSVVSKCNNNEFLFNDSEKFELYIRHLIACKKELGFKMYDMVCMSNHVHELYQVSEKITIAQILQKVKGEFSKKFNKKYGRSGHFWKNKPFYRIIEDERYVLATMNYFHWNPVKAGLVNRPEEWPYSGFKFQVLNEQDGLISNLLDRLSTKPQSGVNKNIQRAVEKIFSNKYRRYIGSTNFRRKMRSGNGVETHPPPKASDTF